MFASEYEEIEPDIMCVAKALSGGVMPISAYITSERVWKKGYGSLEKATLHTSTFGGNAKSAAAGIAVINELGSGSLIDGASEKGEYLLEKLRELKGKYPLIRQVRGRGLMIGVEFHDNRNKVLDRLSKNKLSKLKNEYLGSLIAGELFNKHGIITAYTLNNPNVIRIEPPLTITYEQLDHFVKALNEVCSKNKDFFGIVKSGAVTIVGSNRT